MEPARVPSAATRRTPGARPGGSRVGGEAGRPAPREADTVRAEEPIDYLRRFPVRHGDRFVLLRLDQVRWIEARANYVRVHTEVGAFLQRDSLRRLETVLDPVVFRRVSRYAIVNLDKVRTLVRRKRGRWTLRIEGGQELASTRAYRAALRELLRRGPEEP